MESLAHQRVLVIGGSSGIGLATAASAQQAGADVTIASRSQNRLDAALGALDTSAYAVALDVSDNNAVEAFFANGTPWDHIVISAAHTPMGPVRDMTLSDAHAAMDSKFWGAYHIARSARSRQHGSLTFISGSLSERPSAAAVLQGAINAALEALVRGLALELAPVRVNAVSPGMIDTPLWENTLAGQRRHVLDQAARSLPVGYVGAADDIARAVIYLMTARFATGSTVRVDGGGVIA